MSLFDKINEIKKQESKDPEILDELREIGERRGIEPPEPIVIEHDAESGTTSVTTAAPEILPEPPSDKKLGGPCPACGKEFRHLSRHKCKAMAQAMPVQVDVGASSAPPEIVKTVCCDGLPKTIAEAQALPKGEYGTKEACIKPPQYDLYLDCEVVKSEDLEVIRFSDFLTLIEENIKIDFKVPHWKCVEYGKGAGELSTRVETWLINKWGVSGDDYERQVLVCNTQTPEFRACANVLERYARNIVMAAR